MQANPKGKHLELLRERKGVNVHVGSMIAEIHGAFVEEQAITRISGEVSNATLRQWKNEVTN
jgi:hypothetical protein